MAITVTERPPLELHAEVETPDKATIKWHSGAADPGQRPTGIGFSTARYDGFKTGGCSLPRRIDQPQPDLELFNTLRFIGATGDIAYEGRIAGLPRSTGNPPTWSVQAAGLMANARDRKFTMPFVDRDVNRLAASPVERRALVAGGGISTGDLSWSTQAGGLIMSLPNQALGAQTAADAWALYPEGVAITKVMYRGSWTGLPASWQINLRATDALATAGDSYSLTFDGALRTQALTTTRRFIAAQVYSNGSAGTPAAGAIIYATQWAAYGDHSLTTRPIDAEPDGLYASDAITWLIENYCPALNAGGVQDTTYPIGHLVFLERTHPYDAFLVCNSFHRWGLECWEGGTVHFAPLDLTDYDWEIRLDDFATTLDVSGPVAEEVANGIEVAFTDAATGHARVLLPDDYEELRDTNPLNPVNRAGGYKTTEFQCSQPVTEDMALQIGRVALAEFNAPKHKGTATREGYIKDRAGEWQPVWKVRAGQRVLITDSVDEDIHVVHETDYSNSPRPTIRMAIDDTFQRLDAYLDRYANSLQAVGL